MGLSAIAIRDTGTMQSILLLFQSIIMFLVISFLMIMGKEKTETKENKIMGILKNAYKE